MDAVSSHLAANAAYINEGDFVLDPFCGTGSLLISSAALGAYVVGSDIDPGSFGANENNVSPSDGAEKSKNIRFKRKLESMNAAQLSGGVRQNFEYYQLENKLISLLPVDANTWTQSYFKPVGEANVVQSAESIKTIEPFTYFQVCDLSNYKLIS